MFFRGVLAVVLLPALVSAQQFCIPVLGYCTGGSSSGGTAWLDVVTCTANQVEKLPEDFHMPLYQYIFEVVAKNLHLLPLGAPMKSESEDFDSTLKYEKCLWGGEDEISSNSIDDGAMLAQTRVEESAYNQLFSSRQGGYDSWTGLTLLTGKVVAAVVGYVVFTLTG